MPDPESGVDLRELAMMQALHQALESALGIHQAMSLLPSTRAKIRVEELLISHLDALRAAVRLAYGDDVDPPATPRRPI